MKLNYQLMKECQATEETLPDGSMSVLLPEQNEFRKMIAYRSRNQSSPIWNWIFPKFRKKSRQKRV